MDITAPISSYVASRLSHSDLSRKEETLLFRQKDYKTIIKHNWKYCYSLAKQFGHRGVSLDELTMEAVSAFSEVLPQHDPSLSRIGTHARKHIISCLNRVCDNHNSHGCYKDYLDTSVRQLHAVADKLTQELNREPTRSDMERSTEFLRLHKTKRSLTKDNLLDLWESTQSNKVVRDASDLIVSSYSATASVEVNDLMRYYLKPLTKTEYKVLVMRHFSGMTRQSVADYFERTPQTIDRWDRRAQKKVRNHIISDSWLYERVTSKINLRIKR